MKAEPLNIHDKRFLINRLIEQAPVSTLVREFFKNADESAAGAAPGNRRIEIYPTVIDGTPKVFYFDRVTPASLRLAKWAKDAGALVLFEPSSVGDEKPFQRAIDLCHVLKYSHDRLGHIPDLAAAQSPQLIVETLGAQGLRMRWGGRWSALPAFNTDVFEDAAGSGDWCSAGFLHSVGAKGAEGFHRSERTDLERALKFGQALATLNCRFEGARGLMSFMDHQSVNKALRLLLETNAFANVDHLQGSPRGLPEDLCSLCKPQKSTPASRKKKIG